MNYKESKELLTSQAKFQINLGLERIQSILKLLGNPQEKVKVIHIAGTNGKGSVSAILANILKCSGYKTGLYTSPHLVEYTERIKINEKRNRAGSSFFIYFISFFLTRKLYIFCPLGSIIISSFEKARVAKSANA